MTKRKLLIIMFTLAVAIVTLFAASGVMAQSTECSLLSGIKVTWDETSLQPNGNCLTTYTLSGTDRKLSDITGIDVALPKVVIAIPGSGDQYRDVGQGATDSLFGKDMWGERVYTGNPQPENSGTRKFQIETKTCTTGNVGFNLNAVKSGQESCTIMGPTGVASYLPSVKQKTVKLGSSGYACIEILDPQACTANVYQGACDGPKTPVDPYDQPVTITLDGEDHILRFMGPGEGTDNCAFTVGFANENCYYCTLGNTPYKFCF